MDTSHAHETTCSAVAGVIQRAVAAIASGVLFAFALPLYDVPLLAFVAFVPLLVAVFKASGYRAMWYALLMAITTCAMLLGIPQEPSYTLVLMPFLAFGALTSLVLAVARWLGVQGGWVTVVGTGAAGVLVEWLAASVDFPYTVGLAIWRDALLLWVAGWTGVWGLAFLLWSVNVAIAQAVVLRRAANPLFIVLPPLVLLHALGWLQIALASDKQTVRVAVIQQEESSGILSALQRAKGQGAQLAVLPETCCTETEVSRWAQEMQMWIVFGYWGTGNSASLVAPDGRISPPYHKIHAYGGEPRSWRRGDPVRAFESPFGKLGAVICYDTMFSDAVRLQARNGVRLLAIPTYDPVTPRLALHYLHAASTTLRAAEHRLPLARAEYRAASMVVDRFGRVLAKGGEGDTVVVADVSLGDGRGTLATRLGDYWVLMCALLLVVCAGTRIAVTEI
ncbi:MAG: hypothetical protein KatS3mg022_1033 [Armatimonadota bacterium]|nr:MAG: hypothetical protein KatS3mg022_1033 [Armatimonadota bacterium]